jgi:hypothetical protein
MELTAVSRWSGMVTRKRGIEKERTQGGKGAEEVIPLLGAASSSPSTGAANSNCRKQSSAEPWKRMSGTAFTDERPQFWLLWSGAVVKKMAAPVSYSELLASVARNCKQIARDPNFKQIELDLYRSWPENAFFDRPENIDALRRVLRAWCVLHPDPGYLQSMNFLAAFLLVQIGDEEDTFWVLDGRCLNILTYTHALA